MSGVERVSGLSLIDSSKRGNTHSALDFYLMVRFVWDNVQCLSAIMKIDFNSSYIGKYFMVLLHL